MISPKDPPNPVVFPDYDNNFSNIVLRHFCQETLTKQGLYKEKKLPIFKMPSKIVSLQVFLGKTNKEQN